MGLLSKLFGTGKDDPFQKKVLRLMEPHTGFIDIRPAGRPLAVLLNGVELDLTELSERCRNNEVQTEELIRQYFSFPTAFVRSQKFSWYEAQMLVRPQIVPAELGQRFEVFLLPFAGPLAVAIVIKEGPEQFFVHSEHLKEWNVRPEELFNTSIVNFNSDPVEMEVTITDGKDRFIGLETRDGFDAARILLPKVREFAVSKLGEKYFAGLPNRDFLILWSVDCSPRFQEYACEKIETDFSIQNFPLSPERFVVDNDSISLQK